MRAVKGGQVLRHARITMHLRPRCPLRSLSPPNLSCAWGVDPITVSWVSNPEASGETIRPLTIPEPPASRLEQTPLYSACAALKVLWYFSRAFLLGLALARIPMVSVSHLPSLSPSQSWRSFALFPLAFAP